MTDRVSRRAVLGAGLAGAVCGCLPTVEERPNYLLLSAADDAEGRHFLVVSDSTGIPLRSVPVPFRGHEVLVSPSGRHAVMIGRRPAAEGVRISLGNDESPRLFRARSGRHFYGHAVYSRDENYLFTTENDFNGGRGTIAVRDAITLQQVDEFPSGGVGPHQLAWLNDGRTLVVANGGIRTHPARPRKKLDLANMASNLAFIDQASGKILKTVRSPEQHSSIRHLAVSKLDEVVVGIQYEGAVTDTVPLSLVLDAAALEWRLPLLTPENWQGLHHYVASVAIDDTTRTAAISSPRGNQVYFFSIDDGRLTHSQTVRDVAGIAVHNRSFVTTSGLGAVRYSDVQSPSVVIREHVEPLRWDNHVTVHRLS
ncbi:MAG: DUF1513 domain-containing protein [Pseudomonadota bacterium]